MCPWPWGPKGDEMRSGGFPCRAGCERSFRVADQNSLDALRAASAERTAHEISEHDYHHITMSEERPAYVTPIKPAKAVQR